MNTTTYKLPSRRGNDSSGFTLIELMVTIAVLAIIVGFAAPNISKQLANQRSKSTTATLQNALKEAKIESVIRRQSMTLNFNNNGTSAGIIEIEDANANKIASFTYDKKSKIKAGNGDIEFDPNKTADEMTYTICDSDATVEPRQISVSAIANITSKSGGTCP